MLDLRHCESNNRLQRSGNHWINAMTRGVGDYFMDGVGAI
jgi:hypothetical protein